ncbi:SDR family NAD(P)-dependent oxidoreductase [Streptomyces sp. 7-21]|uniref:SDR family NAD(P)-dependent oxidoreductase n=1 Tax=Streptomyces sp. 7-21 TaxID=2802283 RepID=UPI00191F9D0F|nr:SDR family NAD(P)-dependent oxidoreductase [Streptomyces sp. 7-21]MBL1065928.1 SDR family NAD(P)-dependent oxidoreductase [Streptomyces sp. 7-21]
MLTNPDVTTPDDLHVFTEDWEERSAPPLSPPDPADGCAVVFLSERRRQEEVRRQLARALPGLAVVTVARGAGFRRVDAGQYEIGDGEADGALEDYDTLLAAVAADHGRIGAVLHLWATEESGLLWRPGALVPLLRGLVVRELAPERLLLAAAFHDGLERCAAESWLGFARSLGIVMPATRVGVVCLDADAASLPELPGRVAAEAAAAEPGGVLYHAGRRFVPQVRPAALPAAERDALRHGGTYLITGGMGGLGRIFAQWLARGYAARLVLTGRRPADEEVERHLAALREAGAEAAEYRQADVTDADAMAEAVAAAAAATGRVDGVLHAAGLERGGNIGGRDAGTFAGILAPKVTGTLSLEQALTGHEVGFVVYFSSSAAVLGDFGGCDYACANRFQMSYARHMARAGGRGPRRLAVNWPLWHSRGMDFGDAASSELYLRSSGQRYLEPEEGTALLGHLLAAGEEPQYLALVGQADRLYRTLGLPVPEPQTAETPEPAQAPDSAAAPQRAEVPEPAPAPQSAEALGSAPETAASPQPPGSAAAAAAPQDPGAAAAAQPAGDGDAARQLIAVLRESASQILRIPPDKLAADESLRDYGFDSISLVEFAGVISERFGIEFTPDIFFNYPSLHGVQEFLRERHADKVAALFPAAGTAADASADAAADAAGTAGTTADGAAPQPPAPAQEPAPAAAPAPQRPQSGQPGQQPAQPPAVPSRRPRGSGRRRTHRTAGARFAATAGTGRPGAEEPVAIIGMSGRFPDARTVGELWDILAEGRSVIRPAPAERREWRADGKERRMGWVPGIAEFDPMFFEIAPSEAETMDPRQRLLLEEMWKALEDAGLGRDQLGSERVGVFVGVEEGDYRSIAAAEEGITSNHNAVLAARLSYFLNLTGPGVAINTACSSALLAVHEACLSLRNGDCDTAVVAGVNLMATPREYDALDGAGMLSPQGVCRAFDRRADGMVPGEAVAAIVLKKRDQARRDRHPVYASIIGSGINNDGKTNGITAPSGHAQTRLLREVYERAGISPATVSYLVTHGTGTRLGDPVEINALAEAFRGATDRTGYCALTSTKPNVGHTLAASGLVSLIALTLAMRHETIPPSINCEKISDFVPWASNPFYVNTQRRAWPETPGTPRRGGVSAFGFSGTNAHVVLQSEGTKRGDLERIAAQPARPWHLLVCSAKTDEALSRELTALADHLAGLPVWGNGVLESASYTLIAGRHHFARRCAVVARDREEAVAALRRAAAGEPGAGVFLGAVPRDFEPPADEAATLAALAGEGHPGEPDERLRERLAKLAELYCRGHEPAFTGLWGATPPERMSLPAYAFDHDEYWVAPHVETAGGGARLHPLVHENTSDLSGQRFASAFGADEDWFAPAPGGVRALSAGTRLELARAAVALAHGDGDWAVTLREVSCHEQVTAPAEGMRALRTDLRATDGGVDWALYFRDDDGEFYLAVDGGATGTAAGAAAGDAAGDETAGPEPVDLAETRARCAVALDPAALGADAAGLVRVLADADAPRDGEGLLLLELPDEPQRDAAGRAPLVLVPAQFDACLAAARGYVGWRSGDAAVTAVAEARFTAAPVAARWARITLTSDGGPAPVSWTLGLGLLADDGTPVAHVAGLTLSRERRPAAAPAAAAAASPARGAGEGRRPHMRGWTIEQCVAWELRDAASVVLKIPAEKLDADENLASYGFDSINLSKYATELSKRLAFTLTPDLFFSHPTLNRLTSYLLTSHAARMNERYREAADDASAVLRPDAGHAAAAERKRRSDRFTASAGTRAALAQDPIALIGMSGRFPGARTVAGLWSIVSEGRSAVTEVPEERRPWWRSPGPGGQPRKFGAVPGIDEFDPLFFEISPREAELMDPRQRLLLMEMWRALEDAGYGERSVTKDRIGVFVGVEEGDYRYLVDGEATVTSNSNSVLAARLAYFLDLKGPSMAINTSCSSGLVALHEACLALRNGDCDTAIVAGASIMASEHDYLAMEKATMLSPDGTCYAFDQRANGMVPGEAVAVLVLKRQHAAERDGQRIHATILGSGINYDGRTNGITAPSGEAQARLLRSVYERHQIAPATLDYVVTHGTGTRLGDPIEINALVEAFGDAADRTGYCALTSVKPNLGHSMAASGLVSLLTLVMAMKKEYIPPSINCEELSDYIRWEDSPFYVNREGRPWPAEPGRQRRGAVSSFGVSGTNAHVVLQAYGTEREEAELVAAQPAASHHLLVVSAKTEDALRRRLESLAGHLEQRPDGGPGYMASLSFTLMTGRHHFAHRCAVVAQDAADAARLLREAAAGAKIPNVVRATVSRDFRPNATIEKVIAGLVRSSHQTRSVGHAYQDLLAGLAEFYCQGYPPAFEGLWTSRPRLVGLPGYPFAEERYWAPAVPGAGEEGAALVRQSTSDRTIQRFSSQFTGRESFLSDLLVPNESAQ